MAAADVYAGPPGYAFLDAETDRAGDMSVQAIRAQEQTHRLLFGNFSAAAAAYSHYHEAAPSPVAVAIMGLAAQRDLIERTVSMVDEPPWVGVPLPHVNMAGPPATDPVGAFRPDALRFHAHER